jgi:hypothetical protein
MVWIGLGIAIAGIAIGRGIEKLADRIWINIPKDKSAR